MLGLVPFENSTNGSVVFTLDDLADRKGKYSDIAVNGEIYLDVHHFLLGHKNPDASAASATPGTSTPTASAPNPSAPRAAPLTSVEHVKRIYSHPQAFGQCNAFLSTYLKGVETFEVSSTSKAAEIVSHDTTGTWAAISSELAGQLYSSDVLARNIEDRSDNKTRFLIISSKLLLSPDLKLRWPKPERTGTKSFISLTVPHHHPGALADALGCFREHGVDLTSINSRPSLKEPFQYIFFVEFEGHKMDDPDGRVNGALDDIGKAVEKWRWLGSWDTYQ